MADDTPERAKRMLLQQLESLHRAGVEQIARAAAPPTAAPLTDDALEPALDNVPEVAAPPAVETRPSNVSAELTALARQVAACTQCAELAASRTQTVFGVGNPHARLCFFGEAPGADEDRQGEPFVGRAGRLLTDIIEKGMRLRREDVYILNVLKCRPPGNRNPAADEVEHCRHFFERQLELIAPEFICCLGSIAAQTLLDTRQTVGRLRGQFHDYRGIRVVVTYHPAYLLRSPGAKKDTWQDMQMLMREMGLPIPDRSGRD